MRLQTRYWTFFWPLALLGIAFQSSRLAQNYILLEMESGVSKLALYSLALSFFMPFQAALDFLPQTCTILIRDRNSFRSGIRFVAILTVALLAALGLFSFTPLGHFLLPTLFELSTGDTQTFILYLRWFLPFLVFQSSTALLSGLLIQWHRTGVFTFVRLFELFILLAALFVGIRLTGDPVLLIGAAGNLSRGASALLALFLFLKFRKPFPEDAVEVSAGGAAFLRLFWPMALTSIMFAFNRPILFYFLTKVPYLSRDQIDLVIAGVTLGMSFVLLFQSTANQYRHVGATFTRTDPLGTLRFLVELTVLLCLILVLSILSPALEAFLTVLQNADGLLLQAAKAAVYVMLPTPIILAVRNYFHGVAMTRQRTGIMSLAGLSRVLVTTFGSWICFQLGWLNIIGASAIIVIGFLAEALTVALAPRNRTDPPPIVEPNPY